MISCLIDGCSIRATVRMTGIAKKTVMRVLVEVGEVCADYQDRAFLNLHCKRLQLDEMCRGFIAKRRIERKKLPANSQMLVTFGSGLRWMRIRKLVPSCGSDSAISRPQRTS